MAGTRKINDTGEKIGGARKDWARERMGHNDVLSMTDEELATHVKKDNIWPKPDYMELVESGMDVEAAAYLKVIRDRIASTPVMRRGQPYSTSLHWYFETLTTVRDLAEQCRTVADIKALYKKAEAKFFDASQAGYYRQEGYLKFNAITRGRDHPVRISSFNDLERVKKLLGQGFPNDVPVWKKGVSIRYAVSRGYFIVRGKELVKSGFDSEEAAWDYLKEQYEQARANKTKGDVKKTPDRPHLDRIERKGLEDHRNGADVSPEDFLEVFGFRGVEFGEWLPDDERQKVLNHGYDAFMDLAELTGLKPGQISLDGQLAIAFGARGSSGFAAHYESGRRVVNLTRINGAGALAHEWGHALDHMIGLGTMTNMEVSSISGWRTRYSDYGTNVRHHGPGFQEAFDGLMKAVLKRPVTKDEYVSEIQAKVAAWEKSAKAYRDVVKKLSDSEIAAGAKKPSAKLKKLNKEKETQERGLEIATQKLNEALAKDEAGYFGLTDSEFYKEAVKISGNGGYWARPTEIFARSFEAYIDDCLDDQEASNNYLVAWAKSRFYPSELYKGNPYPMDKERLAMRKAWSSCMPLVAELIPDKSSKPPLNAQLGARREGMVLK